MTETNSGLTRIVRYEVLPGLPGEGPVPKHFHLGHPTPWAEGWVVRFWNEHGTEWVGNFQRLPSLSPTEIVLWTEAKAVVVVASGAFYLIDAANPDDYCSFRHVNGILFDENRETLFVADRIRIGAFGRDRRQRWVRENLGGYNVELVSCSSAVLLIEMQEEMVEPRRAVRIRVEDGTLL